MDNITAMQFPFKTSVVSRKQYDDHITLYNGCVSKVNEINTEDYYRKKDETYAINGVILHELYFQNLGSMAGPVGQKAAFLMDKYWGGFDRWKEDFTACAASARGWCLFIYEQRTATCRNIMTDSHDCGNIVNAYPLIAIDMYEHAYFLDYGTDKASYISRFISNIPWDMVDRRAALVM